MTEQDRFGTVGEKYQFLLQLPAGSAVGLSGPYWEAMAEDFRQTGLLPTLLGRGDKPVAPLAAVFVELKQGWSGTDCLSHLTGSGKAVILFRWRRRPEWWVLARGRSRLTTGNLRLDADFAPVPTLDTVEAFLAGGAGQAAIWRLRGRSAWPGIRERQHFFFVARDAAPMGFGEAARLLQQITGEPSFGVERYHLRRRGAMVFVLRDSADRRRVLRVATNSLVGQLVRQNQRITGGLRERAGLAGEVRQLIPAPLGESSNGSVEAFAEEFRPGRLAWTLYRDEIARRRIDQDLFRFSHGLQLATGREVDLAGRELEAVIDGFLQPIVTRLGRAASAAGLLDSIGQRLRAVLGGRRMRLCVGHGDFGVGNALATDAGAVTAIIDWDQFQESDVPGVDWCDYRLKADHFRRNIFDGLRELVSETTTAGCLVPTHHGFGREDFGLRSSDLRLIPCLAALRDVSRSARFPGELGRPVEHYVSLLELVAQLMPEAA